MNFISMVVVERHCSQSFSIFFALPQYFEHVEEAVWAVQVLKATGKPVAANLCIGPEGDLHGVSPAECAVQLVQAGWSIL